MLKDADYLHAVQVQGSHVIPVELWRQQHHRHLMQASPEATPSSTCAASRTCLILSLALVKCLPEDIITPNMCCCPQNTFIDVHVTQNAVECSIISMHAFCPFNWLKVTCELRKVLLQWSCHHGILLICGKQMHNAALRAYEHQITLWTLRVRTKKTVEPSC